MLFSETKYDGVYPIQAYGKNFFRINGEKINGGIFLYSEVLKPWDGNEDLSFLKEDISLMEILFIGVKEYDHQFQKNLASLHLYCYQSYALHWRPLENEDLKEIERLAQIETIHTQTILKMAK